MPSAFKRSWRTVLAMVTVAAVGVGLFGGLGPNPGGASSHREAPLVSSDPQVDNTDVYMFVSPDDPSMVTMISTWIPFEEPAGGPNFYPFAENVRYQLNIDNDGDAVRDIVYRFVFKDHYRNRETFLYNTGPVTSLTDPQLNFRQTYDLIRIDYPGKRKRTLLNDAPVVPSFVGDASMPDYPSLRAQGVRGFTGGKAFAGQAEDPFFLDLRIFDLLYGGNLSEVGDDTLAGFGVNAIAIQVPKRALAKGSDPGRNPIVGMFSTASRRQVRVLSKENGSLSQRGRFVRVSRLGMPLVNEVVIPIERKDAWNSSKPRNDARPRIGFARYVLEPEVPELIKAIYGIAAPDLCGDKQPPRCRNDLVQVFATGVPGLNKPAGVTPSEMLRLNMSIPPCIPGGCAKYSRLGVIGGDLAGYPNGRRLADDVVDISLQALEGELVGNPNDLGDGVNVNDRAFTPRFPYLGLPVSGSNPAPHAPRRV